MEKIIKLFKHIFIPHIHNDFKPHFFREVSITSILIVVIVLFCISISSKLYIKNTDMMSAVLPAVLVDLTNQDRLANGAGTLTRNPLLDDAARLKAEDMASNQYFAHTSPTGITPWHWFNKVGYSFTYAGENLAIDFTESVDVERAWLNSPLHRKNIMSTNFTEVGIATIEGYYNGTPTTYVVQMFGSPIFTKKTPPTINPTVTSTKTVSPKPIATKEKPISKTEIAVVTPIVKGESVSINEKLETIVETNEFISVKNTETNEKTTPEETITRIDNTKYSKWKDRLIFLLPNYTDKIYKIFVWIVLVALSIMTLIEMRRQHPKNILYGFLLLVIISCFIYINKTMFITSFLI